MSFRSKCDELMVGSNDPSYARGGVWPYPVLLPMAPTAIPECMDREMAFAERCCLNIETDRLFPIRYFWLLDGHRRVASGYYSSTSDIYHPEILLDFWNHAVSNIDFKKRHEANKGRFNFHEKAVDLGNGWIYVGDDLMNDLFEIESCLGREVLFECPETGKHLPVFRSQRLLRSERVAQDVTAGQISRKYSLGFLVKHPVSKPVVLKHMGPLGFDEDRLGKIDGTLREMFERNMGGGIPFSVIVPFMEELDQLPEAAFGDIKGEESKP